MHEVAAVQLEYADEPFVLTAAIRVAWTTIGGMVAMVFVVAVTIPIVLVPSINASEGDAGTSLDVA